MTRPAGPPRQSESGGRKTIFSRRHGKPLRPGRRKLLEERLPDLLLHPDRPDFDPRAAFSGPVKELWLEIGFGGGEHLAWQAEHNPDVGLIGAEPFINGVASLLGLIDRQGLNNIRIYQDDAADLMDALPEASVARCFLLFPDPWPKRRHHKRRFVRPENLDRLARILADGAEFRAATDHMEYGRWMLWHLLAHPAFDWPAEAAADWRFRPADWPQTRYEAKAAKDGRSSLYFSFRRRNRAQ